MRRPNLDEVDVRQRGNLPKLRVAGENQITGRTLYALNAFKSITRERERERERDWRPSKF